MKNYCGQESQTPPYRQKSARLALTLVMTTQLASCATMIFHNGPTGMSPTGYLPSDTPSTQLTDINTPPTMASLSEPLTAPYIDLPLPHLQDLPSVMDIPRVVDTGSQTKNELTDGKKREFEHEVKTSEHIFHYISGQPTSAITLSQWCGNRQWRTLKTEQSALDMIVRWIASPLYAINSLSLSCSEGSTPLLPVVESSTTLASRENIFDNQSPTQGPTPCLAP